jgi:hypothetical protein
LAVLERALADQRPEIFNTDQGVQFTSAQFQAPLLAAQVRLSMDGRGRAFDNIFVERLWRSVKYEEVYLKDYRTVSEARDGLDRYFPFYNRQRIHQALNHRTPHNVHFAPPMNPEVQRTFNRKGARAGAQSSPPCSFNSLMLRQAHPDFHHPKITKDLSRKGGSTSESLITTF